MGKETQVARYLNELTEAVLLCMYKPIALDLFKWDGLPEGLTTDILENMLYENGQVVWFKKENEGIYALKSSSDSQRNIYNQPTAYRWVGHNENGVVQADVSVRMKNNPIMTPTSNILNYFIIKMRETERTIDNHVKAHKVSRIITGDDNTLLSVKNMLQKIDDNEVNIILNKFLDAGSLDVLDLEMTYIIDKLKDYSNEIKNDLHTFLGINNANTDKKERLITAEAESNDDAISRNIAYMLRSREEAVEEINSLLGLSVTVEVAHQSTEPVEDVDNMDQEDEEVDDE